MAPSSAAYQLVTEIQERALFEMRILGRGDGSVNKALAERL